MHKIFNISLILLIISFVIFIYQYYSSSKNIKAKYYNRENIDIILKDKIKDLPVLKNDTDNVVEFNNSFQTEIKNEKKRSFWDLLNK